MDTEIRTSPAHTKGNEMSNPIWTLLHHRMTSEHLGPYLPTFLVIEDERKAAEQFNERYKFGGWRPFGQDKFKLMENHLLKYPGDPPQQPLAITHLRDELILLYPSDVVVIKQPDGSFEVCRMD
jgi:hypothetical protein